MGNNLSNDNPIDYKTPNSLAAIWSMMLPGLGQLMKGQVMPGLFWAFLTAGGYFAYLWPGLILHLLCVLDAALSKGDGSFLALKGWKQKLGFIFLLAFLLAYIVFRN